MPVKTRKKVVEKAARMPVAPRWDITRDDATLTIENPRTGNVRAFRVITQPDNATFAPGRRIAQLFTGKDHSNSMHWTGFAWVHEFGVDLWGRYAESKEYNTYKDMLENIEVWTGKGLKYAIIGV